MVNQIAFEDLNKYFQRIFRNAGIDFNRDLLLEIADKLDWIPIEYRTPDILPFVICNDEYIRANLEDLTPTTRENALIKLYAYVSYNARIKRDILKHFDECRARIGFDQYNSVQVGNGRYNALQTFIYKHISMKNHRHWHDRVGTGKEAVRNLKILIRLVDMSEIDSSGNDGWYYLYNCKTSEELLRRMAHASCIRVIILRIRRVCRIFDQMPSPISTSVSFDNKNFYYELIGLPEYLKSPKYANITERFKIRVNPKEKIVNIFRKY